MSEKLIGFYFYNVMGRKQFKINFFGDSAVFNITATQLFLQQLLCS